MCRPMAKKQYISESWVIIVNKAIKRLINIDWLIKRDDCNFLFVAILFSQFYPSQLVRIEHRPSCRVHSDQVLHVTSSVRVTWKLDFKYQI